MFCNINIFKVSNINTSLKFLKSRDFWVSAFDISANKDFTSNNWKGKNKKVIKNIDLWKKLDDLNHKHNVTWNWVKAHTGNPDNEKADTLATSAIIRKS